MRLKEKFDKNKLFWTSDTHFHHNNIIEFCNRPFGDSKIMDAALIANWNKTVPEDGIVFHLGDFAMTGQIDYMRYLISHLNGTIYWVYGNHCYQNRHDREVIKEIVDGRVMDVAEITVVDEELEAGHCNFFMSHYPHMFWHRGSFHLHGHVHSGPDSKSRDRVPFHQMRYDVGVDNNNYTPISYHQLKVIFTKYAMDNAR